MFSQIDFTWPQTFSAANNQAGIGLSAAETQLLDAKNRLISSPALTATNNPTAAACNGCVNTLNALHSVLATSVRVFTVHPWTQGVGQGDGINRYLSPANAVTDAASKFTDMVDSLKPDTVMDCICILITAGSYAELANSASQFCNLFPHEHISLCARRSAQISTLESEKKILPDAAGNSYWRRKSVAAFGLSKAGASLVGGRLAHAVGYEAGGMPADQELLALADKKNHALSSAEAAIAEMQATFSGGAGRGVFFAAKTPEQIKKLLSAHGLGHEQPLACCAVFTSAPGHLTLIREMLGL